MVHQAETVLEFLNLKKLSSPVWSDHARTIVGPWWSTDVIRNHAFDRKSYHRPSASSLAVQGLPGSEFGWFWTTRLILIQNWSIKGFFEWDRRLICEIYCLPVAKSAWIIFFSFAVWRFLLRVHRNLRFDASSFDPLFKFASISLHPINMVNIFIRFIFEPFETQTPWDIDDSV